MPDHATQPEMDISRTGFNVQLNLPYTLGIYFAINAISDAYLMMDAPFCVIFKAEYLYKNHDMCSTVLSSSGHHRISHSQINSAEVTLEHDDKIIEVLTKIAHYEQSGVLFVCALPMVSITGVQYELIARNLQEEGIITKPLHVLPAKSLTHDWQAGYEEVLNTLAETIEFFNVTPDKNKIALVGYLPDRLEGDHLGNLSEIRRLIQALDLEVASIWLDGSNYTALSKISQASMIFSLPHARDAANTLAQRLSIPCIECPLPFGIKHTVQFIRTIANATERTALGESIIDKELKHTIPLLKNIALPFTLGKQLDFFGDPFFAASIWQLGKELGFTLGHAFLTASEHAKKPYIPENPGFSYTCSPTHQDFLDQYQQAENGQHTLHTLPDLLIGNHFLKQHFHSEQIEFMEFGFPSIHHHCLTEQPFLGFQGCLNFAQRLIYHFRTQETRIRPYDFFTEQN